MAKIKIAPGEEATFEKPRKPTGVSSLADGTEADGDPFDVRRIFGGPDELELFEVRYQANAQTSAHAHEEDEIIYVVEGSLIVGTRTLGPGSALLVPAWTLYGFRAGAEGARFANFRRRSSGRRVINKDEFMAERKTRATAGDPDTGVSGGGTAGD